MDLTELNKVEGKAKSSIFSGIMHSDHSNSVFVMVYNRLSSLSCSLLCFALHTSPCHPSVLMYHLFSVSPFPSYLLFSPLFLFSQTLLMPAIFFLKWATVSFANVVKSVSLCLLRCLSRLTMYFFRFVFGLFRPPLTGQWERERASSRTRTWELGSLDQWHGLSQLSLCNNCVLWYTVLSGVHAMQSDIGMGRRQHEWMERLHE